MFYQERSRRKKRGSMAASVTPASVEFIELNEKTVMLQPSSDLLRLLREGKIPEIRSDFAVFREEILRFDPIHLLGVTALYVSIWAIGPSVEKKPEYQLEVADLEALQALLLASAIDDRTAVISSDLPPAIWSRVRQQHFALVMAQPVDFLDSEKSSVANRVRLHSPYYTTPYGRPFFDRMMLSIAAEFDRRHHRNTPRMSMFFRLAALLLEEADNRLSRFRDVAREPVNGSEIAHRT